MQPPGVSHDTIYVAVVDDDESLCRSFSRLLRTAGFQPVTYASAEALLEDAKRPRFDCLVLDIQLEGMSGVELSRRLAAVKDTTPVIFITAHDEPEVRSQALATGCAGYFRKNDPGRARHGCHSAGRSRRSARSARPGLRSKKDAAERMKTSSTSVSNPKGAQLGYAMTPNALAADLIKDSVSSRFSRFPNETLSELTL